MDYEPMVDELSTTGLLYTFAFLPFLFYLVLIVFGIIFVIKVMKFMNAKIKAD